MPYILPNEREEITRDNAGPVTCGQLNFLLTRTCIEYLDLVVGAHERATYSRLNEVMGVLECVKQEFYRRLAAPYEDQKIKENGDVY